MKIGTKSILFGVHQFLLHPWFVAAAWWKLYGFPWDPRLWVAFFVHDLGYWEKPNMDGPEGETHVELGARIMHRLFDRPRWKEVERVDLGNGYTRAIRQKQMAWGEFCLYHSRFYAKRDGQSFSRLCVADKLSFVMTPRWLYLPLARLSGEIHEYMKLAEQRTAQGEPKYASMKLSTNTQERWYNDVCEYLRRWVDQHKDLRPDTWTPATAERRPKTESGVYQ